MPGACCPKCMRVVRIVANGWRNAYQQRWLVELHTDPETGEECEVRES